MSRFKCSELVIYAMTLCGQGEMVCIKFTVFFFFFKEAKMRNGFF